MEDISVIICALMINIKTDTEFAELTIGEKV